MKNKELKYQSGFGNEFASEALAGALPVCQNSPQKPPHGLYAEQISGTSFTAPQSENRRTWFYRIRPSVCHRPFAPVTQAHFPSPPAHPPTPNQLRWDPLTLPQQKTDFVEGMHTICVTGNVADRCGSAVHIYTANASMGKKYFYNADGDFLVVPQQGTLVFKTECGLLRIEPTEVTLIPRGIKFRVELESNAAYGYVCENYGHPFRLPERGLIGANGLANTRDFLAPTAFYEDISGPFELFAKFQGHLWHAKIAHSPLDVVAWHGNHVPYKYGLKSFQAINTVSYDHPDPSIFTVLTSPSGYPGEANVDFVIFPPRWLVAEHTFRPPYYHRNVMSEYMGLIQGEYDAKTGGEDGFMPGGGSLHNCMSAHGPDVASFEKASEETLKPVYLKNTLAIMFESRTVYQPTEFALKTKALQKNYYRCWEGLKTDFTPAKE